MDKKKPPIPPSPTDAVIKEAEILQNQSRHGVLSDILGSYTGTAADGDCPEQDADDL